MQPLSIDAQTAIDLERYPILPELGDDHRALMSRIHAEIDRDGCCVLKQFLTSEAIARLVVEGDATAQYGFHNSALTNAYFGDDDDSLPVAHPRRRFYPRSNAFIPGDAFGEDSLLRTIYSWEPFTGFIKAALREDNFYPYADPLADVVINMAHEGNGFPWHFDTNNYTVTLAIQNAEVGGEFEYCPKIRTSTDENYDVVQNVLDDLHDGVTTLTLEPGDLQIFKGRYSLHRVKPLYGKRPRYVGIFSYAEIPDMVGHPRRVKTLYGKVLPIHYERQGLRADNLLD